MPAKGNGKVVTPKGYIRLTSGPRCGAYEHRVIIEEQIASDPLADQKRLPQLIGGRLPEKWTVHHMDHNPADNSAGNLLLLGPRLHDKDAGTARMRGDCGHFLLRPKMPAEFEEVPE